MAANKLRNLPAYVAVAKYPKPVYSCSMAQRKKPAALGGFIPTVWPTAGSQSENWPVALLATPFTMTMASLQYWSELSESWWQMVFCPAKFHGHEHAHQLEVPDPIEDEGEHDLFA